jgi:uncharacterized protein YifE (UPF0438 family)
MLSHQLGSRLDGVVVLTERLLLEDEEDGVNELNVFDVVVDHVEGDESLFVSFCRSQRSTQTARTGVKAEVLQMDQYKPCLR